MHELFKEAKEISDEQISDVQTVHISVGGQYHFLVTKALQVVLNVQAAHEVVHLVVLVNDIAFEVPNVERLTLEHEDGLSIHVATAHDGTRRRLSFGKKNHRAFAFSL